MLHGLIATDHDRENLNFLLTFNRRKSFSKFWSEISPDDRDYARELLDAYSLELRHAAQEIQIEASLGALTDAKDWLKKFAL